MFSSKNDKKIFALEPQETDVGDRLDVFISSNIDEYSRTYIKKIIEDGMVKINGTEKKSNYRLKLGDKIIVKIPSPVNIKLKKEKINLDIIYEDDHIIAINKPQGMVVHPAHGNYSGTLVNALLGYCTSLSNISDSIRPGIVHRIDKDTSGIILVAKTNEAHLSLSKQFKEYEIERKYLALLEGRVKEEHWEIDAPIGRHPVDRKRMAVIYENSREAITYFKTLKLFQSNTLIEAQLKTGRTHQIRVHAQYFNHPVVGDRVYGYKKQKFKLRGQLLHAKSLKFIHPKYGESVFLEAPIPSYFERILFTLGHKS